MPISRAASGSWAVARIALPSRLRRTNVASSEHQRDGHRDGEHVGALDDVTPTT